MHKLLAHPISAVLPLQGIPIEEIPQCLSTARTHAEKHGPSKCTMTAVSGPH